MNASDVYNNTFEVRYCDALDEVNRKVSAVKLTISVVLDLLAGIAASGFAYKFYQGIEVAHPIYTIVFTNIIFSTFLSYFAFTVTALPASRLLSSPSL